MDRFISSLPKSVIALAVIIAGFVGIVLNDPPKTTCDSQLELFTKGQGEFIYGKAGLARPIAKQLFSTCKSGNSPGGCFELFVRLRKLNDDLESIPRQCADVMAKDEPLKSWLLSGLKLMTTISWGDRGPASVNRRGGWFDSSDLSLFCDLKKNATLLYGVEEMEPWRENVIGLLPEADKMDHEQLVQKTLFATPCEAYR